MRKINQWGKEKQKKEELKKSEKIIEELSCLKKFNNVLRGDAFKILVEELITENLQGYFMMADINNLKQINQLYQNEEKVDEMIKQLIIRMENTIQKDIGVPKEGYEIGKRGDEIYLYFKDPIDEKKLEKLKEVKFLPLSISIGGTKDFSGSFGAIMHRAEEKMKEDKIKNKREEFIKVSNNVDEILERWLEQILLKLRISHLNELQKVGLKQNLLNANSFIKKIRIPQEIGEKEIRTKMSKKKQKDDEEGKDKTILFKRLVKEEIKNTMTVPLTEEEIDKLVLAKVLSVKNIGEKTYEKLEYFESFGKENLLKQTKRGTVQNMKGLKAIYIDFGRVKYVNDHEGYMKSDKEMVNNLTGIMNALQEEGLNSQYNPISISGGQYIILVEANYTKEKGNRINKRINQLEEKSKLTINYSKPISLLDEDFLIDIKDSPEDIVLKSLRNAIEKGREEVQEISMKKKVKDRESMAFLIVEQLEMLIEHPIIKGYIQSKVKNGEQEWKVVDELTNRAIELVLDENKEQREVPEMKKNRVKEIKKEKENVK